MDQKVINVAKQFSKFPGGRFRTDGDKSGEAFREDHLEPIIAGGKKASIELDGVLGYGSSFLEEAFGGLIRNRKVTESQFWEMFELKTQDMALLFEIKEYIHEAQLEINTRTHG